MEYEKKETAGKRILQQSENRISGTGIITISEDQISEVKRIEIKLACRSRILSLAFLPVTKRSKFL